MPDIPTDAVQGRQPAPGIPVRQAFQTAFKFASGEAQLIDHWMRHVDLLLKSVKILIRGWKIVRGFRGEPPLMNFLKQFLDLRNPRTRFFDRRLSF
jgi:hypothetical protein